MKTILFDFDGTLVDTQYLYNIAISKVLYAYNSRYTVEYCTQFFDGKCWNDAFTELSEKEGFDKMKVFNEGLSYAQKLIKKHAHVTNKTQEALHFLRANNIEYAICSNSHSREIGTVLKHTKLDGYFTDDIIFGRECVVNGKPESDIYLYALEKLNKKNTDCIVIEDSINGAKAGINANIETIIFTGGTGFSGMEKFYQIFGSDIKSYHSMMDVVQYALR